MSNGDETFWILERAGSEVTLTAAATVDIGSQVTPRVLVSGAGQTITSFGSDPNRLRLVHWDGINTLVNSAALALSFATNSATQAGEFGWAVSDNDGNFSYFPIAPLVGAGGGGIGITEKSVDYSALVTDNIIRVNATAAARTITVPTARPDGTPLRIEKTDLSANPVYINDGTSVIDALVTPATVLGKAGGWRIVYWDGSTLVSTGVG